MEKSGSVAATARNEQNKRAHHNDIRLFRFSSFIFVAIRTKLQASV